MSNLDLDKQFDDSVRRYKQLVNKDIPNLQMELKKLKEEKKNVPKYDRNYHDNKIRDMVIRINQMKRITKDHLLRDAPVIFKHYETKQFTSNGDNLTDSVTVREFFGLQEENDNNIENRIEFIKTKRMYQKYWKTCTGHLSHPSDYVVDIDKCPCCHVGEMVTHEDEGILICNNPSCRVFIPRIVDTQPTVYNDVQSEVYCNTYMRIIHFKELISQFRAKQTTTIPTQVMNDIVARMKKERMTKNDINYLRMRHVLTVLNLSRYFDHIYQINSLLGVRAPVMDDELHDTLCVLFIEVQHPWVLFCPKNRLNFFNYTYVFHQLLRLLGQTQYLEFMAGDREMKDRGKQIEQDIVWKKVCDYLGWAYIPTV